MSCWFAKLLDYIRRLFTGCEAFSLTAVENRLIFILPQLYLYVVYLFCILRGPSKVIFSAKSLGNVKGILPEAFWYGFSYLFSLRLYSAEGHPCQETWDKVFGNWLAMEIIY